MLEVTWVDHTKRALLNKVAKVAITLTRRESSAASTRQQGFRVADLQACAMKEMRIQSRYDLEASRPSFRGQTVAAKLMGLMSRLQFREYANSKALPHQS